MSTTTSMMMMWGLMRPRAGVGSAAEWPRAALSVSSCSCAPGAFSSPVASHPTHLHREKDFQSVVARKNLWKMLQKGHNILKNIYSSLPAFLPGFRGFYFYSLSPQRRSKLKFYIYTNVV